MDHFYNFCITAHALRDYYLNSIGISGDAENRQHDEWNEVEVVRAVREIANTAKHWKLRPAKGKEVRRTATEVLPVTSLSYAIYQSDEGGLFSVEVEGPSWVVEVESGAKYDLWEFQRDVVDYWREFLESRKIRVGRQPEAAYFGEDETQIVSTPTRIPHRAS